MKKAILILAILPIGISQWAQGPYLQSQAVDVREDFHDFTNTYFYAGEAAAVSPTDASGKIVWRRFSLNSRQAFNTTTAAPMRQRMLDFPAAEYENDPALPFDIDFIGPRTVRVRVYTSPVVPEEQPSLMLAEGQPTTDGGWTWEKRGDVNLWKGPAGAIGVQEKPFRLILYDADGRELTATRCWEDNDSTQVRVPAFQFVKRASDNIRSVLPVLDLHPYERIVGCGESPTAMNKVGQVLHLFVTDPQGPEGDQMYKPIPFFFSNRGYGVFMHTSAPVTCDFGASYTGATKLFMEDETMDFFFFLGNPKEILDAYTDLTGKPSMPPTWSFGTWISRITYLSQAEGLEVASKLRGERIPADVIHFDTGWFARDWECDYEFDPQRFPDAPGMIRTLRDKGFRISLWQLPYFTPKNRYYNELIDKGLYVKNGKGGLPYEDVVLDFSNPETVDWYQGKIADLLKLGVGAIKVDFGEAAPLNGQYASGRSGLYEHNLYPLRYNKAVADITFKVTGEHIMWARSAWAGSQRYPLHWGGDAATTDVGLAATLRSGLSFGLSGFSFWSHDIGGFVKSTPEGLYRRWLPFGFLSSHSRIHGAPPTEPWHYGEAFTDYFRKCAEMKYSLMPYIVEQAKQCCEQGLPMLRALLVEYPGDPAVWTVDDEYLFGSDILVAPFLEDATERAVYLPGGDWVDYQSGRRWTSGWHTMQAGGEMPCVILVRRGAAIPTVPVAQCTDDINWSKVKYVKY